MGSLIMMSFRECCYANLCAKIKPHKILNFGNTKVIKNPCVCYSFVEDM